MDATQRQTLKSFETTAHDVEEISIPGLNTP